MEEHDELKAFVCHLTYMEASELDHDTPLFSAGLIDSISLLEVISFVEETYAIKVEPSLISLEHWDSLARIKNLINTKQRGS